MVTRFGNVNEQKNMLRIHENQDEVVNINNNCKTLFPPTFPQLSPNFPPTFPQLSPNFPPTFPQLSHNFP